MNLTDFQILADDSFTQRVTLNGSSQPVEEALRFEIAARPRINAPFRKLAIEMSNSDAGGVEERYQMLINVGRARIGVSENQMPTDSQGRNGVFLDAIERALRLIERSTGWFSEELNDAVASLRARHPVGLIELRQLERTDRARKRWVRVFYEVTENSSAVDVAIFDADGQELRRERVAHVEMPKYLELFFPVASAILKDGEFVLRDRDRSPLATVAVP